MDEATLRGLLYRAESVDLDFKREQYRLSGSDAEKSELVKDVLAMANAWRESTGYILLGVAENKPDLPTVVGITELHDDAHFQQLVNSKVHPKISFAYEVCKLDGLLVGIISVPKQKRPFFLPKRFGNVDADTVYLRRGSSTAVAKPDEIARMGQAEGEQRDAPRISLTLLDSKGEDVTQSPRSLALLNFGDVNQLPDYQEPSVFSIGNPTNHDFWRDAAHYLADKLGWMVVAIRVKNESRMSLTHCKLELTVKAADEVFLPVRDADDLAKKPRHGLRIPASLFDFHRQHDLSVSDATPRDPAACMYRIEKLLAGDTVTSLGKVALTASESGVLMVNGRFFAHELEAPISLDVQVATIVEHRAGTIGVLRKIFEKKHDDGEGGPNTTD